jgi:hypothetical protein
LKVRHAGNRVVVTRATSFPFCFDWTIEQTMLVTGRNGLDRLGADGALHPHADLSHLFDHGCNEVAVHLTGAAYVNTINFDMMGADGMDFQLGSKHGQLRSGVHARVTTLQRHIQSLGDQWE